MVVMAQQEAIGERRPAAVGPMPHVMRVAEAEPAAREPASEVADLESTPKRRRDGAGPSANIEDLAVRAVPHSNQRRIACEAPRRFIRVIHPVRTVFVPY
jgi:hypothetical protein